MLLRRWKILIVVLAVGGANLIASLARAQNGASPWLPPANVSNSGAASRPVIVATTDGVLHALWWDTALGTSICAHGQPY